MKELHDGDIKMNTAVQFLEAQLDKLKKEAREAKKRVKMCEELLESAKREEEESRRYEKPSYPRKIHLPSRARSEISMPDQIAQLLSEHDGLTSSELYELLKEERPNTSVNSINTQLSRHKNRFTKIGSNWFVRPIQDIDEDENEDEEEP